VRPKFIVDLNVGKLAKWLRVLGYDTLFFTGPDDNEMIRIALREGRIILTKDSHILKRRVCTIGPLKVLLIRFDDVHGQLRQVAKALELESEAKEFSLCIECNEPLVHQDKALVEGQVPPYVYEQQESFMGCSRCRRIYWQGSHWQRMKGELAQLRQ